MQPKDVRTWIEISKGAARHNFSVFRRLLGKKTAMLGVVKSNAYGHELLGFSKLLASMGIDWLGVDSITEGAALRKNGISVPILVLGYTLPAKFAEASRNRIALTISGHENLKQALKLRRRIAIHLKVDTGMHRQGFFTKELPEVLKAVAKAGHLELQGLYTHFGAAKNPDISGMTARQIRDFNKAVNIVKFFKPSAICHASATAGALNFPQAHYDMARIGAGLYGLWPSPETMQALRGRLELKPVLTWKTIVGEIKTVEKGQKIGYDYTETLKRKSRIAILPIGYWHGYWRAFSSQARVLIKGKKAKVLGRVCMDMATVDITDISGLKPGNEAVLIGKGGSQQVTADDLAVLASTTNYEIVTRLNPLIRKYFV